MNILLAPAQFKESMSAGDAAKCWAGILNEAGFTTRIQPLSDGGEGFLNIFLGEGAREISMDTVDCLGRPVTSSYGIYMGKAIIEMARTSGLEQIPPDLRDPLAALTLGTGLQLRHAIEKGPEKIIIGLGGSATNDGGLGIFLSLGGKVLNVRGEEIRRLVDIDEHSRLDSTGIPRSGNFVEIIAATDVKNTLLGGNGATRIFGPQKGIADDQLEKVDNAMASWATLLEDYRGAEYRHVPGSGAAGGLGFGLIAICNARVRPGFDVVAETVGLEARVKSSDLVITGEGKLDRQTSLGKAPFRIMEMARTHGKPVVVVAGTIDPDTDITLYDQAISLTRLAGSGEAAVKHVRYWMKKAMEQVISRWSGYEVIN